MTEFLTSFCRPLPPWGLLILSASTLLTQAELATSTIGKVRAQIGQSADVWVTEDKPQTHYSEQSNTKMRLYATHGASNNEDVSPLSRWAPHTPLVLREQWRHTSTLGEYRHSLSLP